MLAWLGKWLLGGGISAIGGQINEWQRTKLEAANNSERVQADIAIAELHARRDALAHDRAAAYVRAAWALPFVIYDAKLILWDKVFGLGATDPLSDELFQIQMVIIAFYFLHQTAKLFRK